MRPSAGDRPHETHRSLGTGATTYVLIARGRMRFSSDQLNTDPGRVEDPTNLMARHEFRLQNVRPRNGARTNNKVRRVKTGGVEIIEKI